MDIAESDKHSHLTDNGRVRFFRAFGNQIVTDDEGVLLGTIEWLAGVGVGTTFTSYALDSELGTYPTHSGALDALLADTAGNPFV